MWLCVCCMWLCVCACLCFVSVCVLCELTNPFSAGSFCHCAGAGKEMLRLLFMLLTDGSAGEQCNNECCAEVKSLRAKLEFMEIRRSWPGLSVTNWDALSANVQHELLTNGSAHLAKVLQVKQPQQMKPAGTDTGQVGGGKAIHALLSFQGQRPVWSHRLLRRAVELQAVNVGNLSPRAYPHSAEDIMLACQHFHHAGAQFAVFSSISPWVELTLLKFKASAHITTIDYNPPLIDHSNIRAMAPSQLPNFYAQYGGVFSLVVAFSGLEHDGLGRYGDPVNPNGDLAALREIFLLVEPGGVLLLSFPTCFQDTLYYPEHRFYGPTRLNFLLTQSRFTMVGRVWNGMVVKGGMDSANEKPTLWVKNCGDWRHQQVLVLQKPSNQTI